MATHEPPPRTRTVSHAPPAHPAPRAAVALAPHAGHRASPRAHAGHAQHQHLSHYPHHPHHPHEAPPSSSRLVRIGQNLLPWVVALLGLIGAAALIAAPAAAQALAGTQ